MGETMRIVVTDCDVSELALSRKGAETCYWTKDSRYAVMVGITSPGVYDVTVRKVEPTWPWVKSPTTIYAYCGACNQGQTEADVEKREAGCPVCHVTLVGEVPQSKVADFLRQES